MAIEALYVFSTGLTKISILLFYRRLVSGSVSRAFVWTVLTIIVSVMAYIITFELTLIFGLNADQYFCLDEVVALYCANIISIVQDFLTFLMPLLLFWNLQLPIRQKVVLGCIFSVGFFICIVGIIRIVYTERVYFSTYDTTWASQPVWIWTAVELHGAIVCASTPALKVFFERFLRAATTYSSSGLSRGSRLDGSKKLRDTEEGSEFAMVSQRSVTQSGGSTHTKGLTVAEYETCVEKMEIEELGGNASGSAQGTASTNPVITPYPDPLDRPTTWKQRSRTLYNMSSCSWYDD